MLSRLFQCLGLLFLLSVNHIAYANTTQIDLMVVYTASALDRTGGREAIERAINYAVVNTNTIYRNSGVHQRLRLVHTAQTEFRENAIGNTGDAVKALQAKNDGHLDEVHGLRNTYGADLVMLLVDGDVWPDWTGGDANTLYELNSGLSEYAAFSIVDWEFLEIGTAFPHELGHSMGLQHDWYISANELTPYVYARGYVNENAGWRTIMAYDDKCNALGKDCPRVFFFSNPDLSYQGQPLGVAEGTNTGCSRKLLNNPPCDADARKTLNNTAATVAGFRTTIISNTLGVAEPISPLGTLQTYTPQFSWKAIPGTTRYRLLVGVAPAQGTAQSLQNGKAILLYQWYNAADICTPSICTLTPDVHFSNGNHYWTVQPHNDSSWGLWSDVTDFTLFSSNITGGPNVIPLAPADKSITGSRPTFYWQPAFGGSGAPAAIQYNIFVWSFDTNNTVYFSPWYDAASVCNGISCAVTPAHILPTGNYLWRIRSNSIYGEGNYDTRWDFYVNPARCSGSSNKLLFTGSYYLLTLEEGFCLGSRHYANEASLMLKLDSTWDLVGQVNLASSSANCPAMGNLLESDVSSYTLTVPNFCLNGNVSSINQRLRLNLNGQWELIP